MVCFTEWQCATCVHVAGIMLINSSLSWLARRMRGATTTIVRGASLSNARQCSIMIIVLPPPVGTMIWPWSAPVIAASERDWWGRRVMVKMRFCRCLYYTHKKAPMTGCLVTVSQSDNGPRGVLTIFSWLITSCKYGLNFLSEVLAGFVVSWSLGDGFAESLEFGILNLWNCVDSRDPYICAYDKHESGKK